MEPADGYYFLGGWAFGVFLEWLLHWIMHRYTLGFHIGHHREFFHDPPREVALRTVDPRMDIKFFLAALLLLSPLMYWLGWAPVLLTWAGTFWQVVIVYEACHAVMHHDAWLPRFVREWRVYRWWKCCHYEHHFHEPAKNYSVTFPVIDWLFGTYAHPRADYPTLPHPAIKPATGEGYTVEREA